MNISAHYDAVILGAGPAGMSAAIALQGYGLSVAVFDEQASPGGQIYRGAGKFQQRSQDQKTVRQGRQLVAHFMQAEVDYFPETFVWYSDGPSLLAVKYLGQVYKTSCRYLLVATGAQERPVVFQGWELPGVMGVGAAQVFLKEAGAVPDEPPVLFGSGPLLYLYAAQLIAAGVRPQAILDTTDKLNRYRSIRHLPSAVSGYLVQGLRMLLCIRRAGVPVFKQLEKVQAFGGEKLERIDFISEGEAFSLNTSLFLSHHGVIPETRLLQSIDVDCRWDENGQCWRPTNNKWGESSVEGVYVAGDVAGISGAISAGYTGGIAALDILFRCKEITEQQRDAQSTPLFRKRKRDLKIRAFLESRYRVSELLLIPAQHALVCRCESVTADEISAAIRFGCKGPNQLKAFTRCGMGACQGRMCGQTAEAMIARATGLSRDAIGRFRARAPVRPVSIGALASLRSHISKQS